MKPLYYACDFETTVFENQSYTAVWSAAMAKLWSNQEAKIFHSISEWWEAVCGLRSNLILYFHNLRFDGAFILYFFENTLHYKQGITQTGEKWFNLERKKPKKLENKEYIYLISDMGQWYSITVRVNDRIIEIRDSLKILPFSLEKIGKDFDTPHKKGKMKYEGFRFPGCEITEAEKEYIRNDVYVLREALEMFLQSGHTKLTIGSCCLTDFWRTLERGTYKDLFPRLDKVGLDAEQYGSANADAYIRRAYRGGWCFLKPGRENRVFENGLTLDVNSLYPSVMLSASGNAYPVGLPQFWKGGFPAGLDKTKLFYYVRFQCRFKLKPGKFPSLQIKKNNLYPSNKWLETSDIQGADGKYYPLVNKDGLLILARPVLTMAKPDFELFCENYDLTDFEILDGCYFQTKTGLFDKYLLYWKKQKETQTGAKRTIAKLFSNNLYGRLSTSPNSSYKIVQLSEEDNSLEFLSIPEADKKPVYIAAGAAVTAYARSFIIRAAQANYKVFVYADTDSLHLTCGEADLRGVSMDANEYGKFKIEKRWKKGLFIRQKTYIEYDDSFSVTAAGMPQRCKNFLSWSMSGKTKDNCEEIAEIWDDLNEEKREFITTKRTIEDFKIGLKIPGKLIPRQIPGGCVLEETYFTVRG